MNPVRVLHIEITKQIGGIERFLYCIYQNIDRNLVQFDFVTMSEQPAFADKLKVMGANIYRVTPYTKNLFKYLTELKAVIRQGKYRIVHIHKNSATNILPLLLCSWRDIETIITHSHNTSASINLPFNPLHYCNRGLLIRRSTALLACSVQAAEWLFGRTTAYHSRVTIIKNGIEAATFRFNEADRGEYRRLLGLDGKFVIGHIGRFTLQKNHEFLLDIFHEVYSKNHQAVLMLIGAGELQNKVKEKADRLGLSTAIMFMGERDDVPKLMQVMDVFVFPSLYEGLGIALIEAQAAGLKCIASDCIAEEARITENLKLISLQQPERVWADEVLKYRDGYTREDTSGQIVDAGYDCKDTAQKLQGFYLEQTRRL